MLLPRFPTDPALASVLGRSQELLGTDPARAVSWLHDTAKFPPALRAGLQG